MALKTKKINNYVDRLDFSKVNSTFELPNLIEVQTEPYKWFIKDGIQEVFDQIFPIVRNDGEVALMMNKWWIKDNPMTPRQAREESKNYHLSIYASMTLTINSNQNQILKGIIEDEALLIKNSIENNLNSKLTLKSTKKDIYQFTAKINNTDYIEILVTVKKRLDDSIIVDYYINRDGVVFLGDFPKMTKKGTFIINGSEKVVVLQLVRSPGAYLKSIPNPKTGNNNLFMDIIPGRGTWLEFKSDMKNPSQRNLNPAKTFCVKIDKSRKVTLTNFLTALGFTKPAVEDLFDNNQYVANTYDLDDLVGDFQTDYKHAINEIYRKIRSGEIATSDGAARFLYGLLFNTRAYDLNKAGRYKLNQKLNVMHRVVNRVLAESIKDDDGRVLMRKGTLLTPAKIIKLGKILETGVCDINLECSLLISENKTVEKIRIYGTDVFEEITKDTPVITIIGSKNTIDVYHVTVSDIIAAISTLLNLTDDIGITDDIDNLGNRRVRTVGELLQNQFRIGMLRINKNVKEKMATLNAFKMKPINILSNKPLTAIIGEFFNLSQLCQFLDQTNPLSELANKRRITALGPGGLSRERAGLEVRDAHHSYYGRLCVIQTPEGPNIGLINNMAIYAKINEYGFIETPYRKVKNNKVLKKINYLSADEEAKYVIAQANTKIGPNGVIIEKEVVARYHGDNMLCHRETVDYIDVSPKQIVSISASGIPFLENNDTSRVLMGSNMQAQAVPLINPQSPIVGTGVEHITARDSGLAILASKSGIVKYADSCRIIIDSKDKTREYLLDNFERSNQKTALIHTALVKTGDRVKAMQVIADGPSMEKGELALGQNVRVAFTTWNGYNFEDAVIISERLQIDDVFTSLHITEYKIERRKTKQGVEEITAEVPNLSEKNRVKLDEFGFAMIGSDVKCGDILVGKVTPRAQIQISPEDKLLQAIFGEKSKGVKDNSLRVPNGGDGIVQSIKRFTSDDCELPADVLEIIKVSVVQKRKLQEGDKMAGRHGNKGVISIILPVEDMPHTKAGQPIDILLNPLGVPSRMNIGQVLETHLGLAAYNMGKKVSMPVFESVSEEELEEMMKAGGVTNFGKETLIDGRTGEAFDNKICTGIMYMLKLAHMVDDKIHMRNIGPYSLITQQPLGGKAQNGGQRFGEMEVWALEAYGAAHTLQEILTLKSDDIRGRAGTYQALISGRAVPKPGIPESFNVLMREIKGLGFDIRLIDEDGNNIKEQDLADTYKGELVTMEDISDQPSLTTDTDSLDVDAKLASLFNKDISKPTEDAK